MPDQSAERRSELRVLLTVLFVVLAVAAVAAVAGLVNRALPADTSATAGGRQTAVPDPVGDIGAEEPGASPLAERSAADMRAELDAYLKAYGNVSDFEVLPIGKDGKPTGSRFARRVAPGARFLAESGGQTPPVFAEAVVTRADGSRFAVLLVYRPNSAGDPAWSDLLTSTLP